ncbi:hypothetical protein MASR2M79_06100 [Aminivibrio sp.]
MYDRFRGRIIFPSGISQAGLAFGGRLLDGEGAKSSAARGTLYSKRRNLYLLHRAKAVGP